MTCICIDDLRPASFRGVGFYVASDKGEYGRRNIVHEYPHRPKPYVEDMGEKARKYHVSGYLVGDDWVAQKDALVAACSVGGPALLQLPTESPLMVACNSLTVSRTKDACGFYSLTMEFVDATNFGVPTALGVFESIIGIAIAQAVPVFTSYFDQRYVAANTLQYVEDNQTDRIAQFTADVIRSVESTPSIDDSLSAQNVQIAIGIFQNASNYAKPDIDRSVYLAAQPIPAKVIQRVETDTGYAAISDTGLTVTTGASAIVPLVAEIMNNLGNSITVDAAIDTLTDFAVWSAKEVDDAALKSPSDKANAINGKLLCGVVRSFALMKLAQAISVKDFRTRQEAIQARANVVELFNAQINEFDEDEPVNLLLTARDNAVNAITQKMATLVPVISITASESKPSLYWASRIYQDVTRAEELADRNHVAMPAFMPIEFEALAR